MKRFKTNYPGIFYRETQRTGGKGPERVYYIVYKKAGKVFEEKAGRQYADAMTPSKAASIRGQLIERKRPSRKEIRELEKAAKEEIQNRWTIDRLWTEYKGQKHNLKGIVTDENRYQNHIKPAFGTKEPGELSPLDVDRIRITLLKTKAPATVRNVLELLRRIINFGQKRRLCKAPDFVIEMPRVDNETTEDLTPEQLARLLKAIDEDPHPQAGNIMKLAMFTGLRRGELFRLQWHDIDFERGFISLRNPKGGQDQKVPLNDATRGLLTTLQKDGQSPYLFPGRGGKQRTDIAKAVNKIKRKAGLPKNFRPLHGLRHFYASMLASSGAVDMYTLQKLLTHKDERMTQRYAHLRDEALRRASDLAGEIISEVLNKKNG